MEAAEVLDELHNMGISLAALPGGRIAATPKRAITDEARRLIRTHKPEILKALTISPAAFYECVLGNEPKSIATLELEQRAEALRIGLLPREIAESNAVVLAYRNNGAQGLMTIPADRYDGLRVLELFDLT